MPLAITRTVNGVVGPWVIEEPDEKLAWRGGLPGASTFDRVAHTLRALQAEGAAAIDLLPLALPASWMVNTKATSHAMQRWLSPAAQAAWSTIMTVIAFGLAPAEWLSLPQAEREAVTASIEALIVAGDGDGDGKDGASITSVTKVLALLRPQIVPLMDAAALRFALEIDPVPASFVPMLDWFAREVVAQEEELVAIAVRHRLAVLDAAQVLDRLVWMESAGNQLRARTTERRAT